MSCGIPSQNFRSHNTCSDGLTGTAANWLEPECFSQDGKSEVILPNHGSPGLRAMGWLADFVDSVAAMLIDELAGDRRMFPDGNASVARLLVQKMIPQVAPGMKGVEDVAITRFD